jgi:hypothetical protein
LLCCVGRFMVGGNLRIHLYRPAQSRFHNHECNVTQVDNKNTTMMFAVRHLLRRSSCTASATTAIVGSSSSSSRAVVVTAATTTTRGCYLSTTATTAISTPAPIIPGIGKGKTSTGLVRRRRCRRRRKRSPQLEGHCTGPVSNNFSPHSSSKKKYAHA